MAKRGDAVDGFDLVLGEPEPDVGERLSFYRVTGHGRNVNTC
jgi:hypothetical protein